MDDICGAMIQIDASGKIIFWNQSAEDVLGFKESDVIGQNAFEIIFINNKDGDDDLLKVIKTKDVFYTFDSTVLNSDGDLQTVALVISPLQDENDEVYGITVLVSNVLMF